MFHWSLDYVSNNSGYKSPVDPFILDPYGHWDLEPIFEG